MDNNIFTEKSLKRFIKTKKIGYSVSLLVSFLITGNIVFGQELSSSQIKTKIEKNNQRLEEIEKRLMELMKEGDYYAKTLEDNNQFFFPLDIEHRHSRRHQHFAISKPQGPMVPVFPSRPILKPEVPDKIEGGTPDKPNLPDRIEAPVTGDIIEIGEFKIEVTSPTLGLQIDKPNVNFDRNYITEIDPKYDDIKVPDINTDEKEFTEINIGKYETGLKVPEKHYSYDPTYAKTPDLFDVPDVERPTDIILPNIKINTEAFEQGSAGLIQNKEHGGDRTAVENYKNYKATGDGLEITINDFYDTKAKKDRITIDYSGLENFDLTTVGNKEVKESALKNIRREFSRGTGNESWLGRNLAFISSTAAINSEIDGKYKFNYGKSNYGDTRVTRTFLSVNPAGLYGSNYNQRGDETGGTNGNKDEDIKIGATTDFKGELTLTNKSVSNGALIGIDHQLWDSYLKFDMGDNKAHDRLADSIDQLKYYSIAKNSGKINLGENENDQNLVGMTISQEREVSALLKLNNHVTLNDGEININGTSSLGISYEYGGGPQVEGQFQSHDLGVNLDDDLYVGNINLNSTSSGSYGVRLQNVFYDYKSKEQQHIKNVDFTNKHFYDNARIFGSLEDNQGDVKENIKDLPVNPIDTVKKIALSGTNNAGFVVAKSLSDGAERYLANTEENKKLNKKYNIRNEHALDDVNKDLEKKGEKKIDITTDYIGKFNGDLKYNDGTSFAGFDFGKVNPIANIHGLNIEVNGTHSVGFLRYKDYSDNNKNDMIITNEKTGAIKEIDFGKDAQSSVLIRSDMYGINVEKDLDIKGDGTSGEHAQTPNSKKDSTNKKPEKNIILQATKSIWSKVVEGKEKDVKSVGHIINSGKITSSQDNIIGMMANTVNPEQFEKNKENATALNGYDKTDAEIINRNTIELTGKNVIGMAVLDGNKGYLDNGKVSTTTEELPGTVAENEKIKDYNVSIYNNGNFNIMNSTIETSGKGSIALYNNEGNIELRTNRSIDGKNDIKATNGAIGIYSKGGTITSNGNLNVTADTGMGIYAISSDDSNAKINLNGATIKVGDKDNNGEAGIVAIGRNENARDYRPEGSETTITLENSTLDYKGRGFALFTKGDGKIKIKDSTINLDGQAFGMNVEYGVEDKNRPITFEGDNNKIHVKSNDVTIFNIVSKGDKKFNSNLSELKENIGNALGNNKELLDKITAESGVTSYKTAIVDGGSLTIDKDIYKSATEEDQKQDKFGYFYFKRFLGQRLKTTVNKNVKVDATVTGKEANDYYNGKVTGFEIVSSKNAKSVDETSLTLEKGVSVIANRIDLAKGEETKDKNTVGVFSDYANITMKDGSSIIVEKKDDNNKDDKSFNGVGIFAVNGSNIKVGETPSTSQDKISKAEISVYGDNAVGIYAKAYRTEYIKNDKGEIEEKVVINEYGEQEDQGKINVENNGIIDVSNGAGTVGIYANNNNEKADKSSSIVINNGTIKVGKTTKDISSIGINAIKSEITNKGTIEITDGVDETNETTKETKSYGSVGIKATKNSVIKDIGTLKFGKNAIGVIVDNTSEIKIDKNKAVKFEDLNSEVNNVNPTNEIQQNKPINKLGIAYNNMGLKTERVHDFNIDAKNATGINVIATKEGTLKIEKDTILDISDNHSVGIIVEGSEGEKGNVYNNGTINIGEVGKSSTNKEGTSVGILAVNKNGHIFNEGTINLNSDDAIGLYISNKNATKGEHNTIEKIGKINIKGKNNKGVYVASSMSDGVVGRNDIEGVNFEKTASESTGFYLEDSKIKLDYGSDPLKKSLGKKDAGNVFIRGFNTTVVNEGELIFTNEKEVASGQSPKTGEVYKNIGILLDENSNYKGTEDELGTRVGKLRVENGAIGIYSKVGEKSKEFSGLKMTIDSQNEETIGLALKGKKGEKSIVTLKGNGVTPTTDINFINTSSNNNSGNKSVGIAANDVDLNLGSLNLNYKSTNDIGIYLKDNASIQSGKITISGEEVSKQENPDFSIGVYANDKSAGDVKSDIEIKKKDTIGVYNNKSNLNYQGKLTVSGGNSIGIYTGKDLTFADGSLVVKGGVKEGDASVGIYSIGKDKDNINKVTSSGRIYVNGERDTGIFGKHTNFTNNKNIAVNGGVGAILKGEGSVYNGSKGIISGNKKDSKKVTGLYLIDGAKLGDGINLNLGSNQVGIYGENTVIDGSGFTKKDENRGIIDLSSDKEAKGIKGIVVNKVKKEGIKDETLRVENLTLKLGEGSIGIAALDNDTSINNIKITSNSSDSSTTGIYLKNKEGSNKNFTVNNTEINLKNGYGILVSNSKEENEEKLENDRTVVLSNSKINIDGILSKEDNKVKAVGIYLEENNNLKSKKNDLRIKNGVAIYGEGNSEIDLTSTDIILEEDAKGIYTNGGKVILDETSSIKTANKGGNGAVFVRNGDIESSATISGLSDSFYGLFIDSSNKDKASSLINKGSVTLIGKDNIGIALKGKGDGTKSETANKIENSGDIIVSTSNVAVPLIEDPNNDIQEQNNNRNIGIYGENANIINTGAITVGGKGIGIASVNAEEGYKIDSKEGNIVLLGEGGIGAYLEGKGAGATFGNIIGEKGSSGSVGLVLKDYASEKSVDIGNIELNNGSLGIHIENKNKTTKPTPTKTTINIDKIEVGKNPGEKNQSVGVLVDETLTKKENERNTTILNIKDKLSTGINGTTIFNKGGNIEINAIEKLEVGKGTGALIHSSSGKITLDTQVKEDDLTINIVGTNGFVSGNGNIIEGTENLKNKNLTLAVSEGGTGVIFIEHYPEEIAMGRPTMDIGIDKILVKGDKGEKIIGDVKFTKGVHLHNLGGLKEEFKTNLEQVGGHTVGTVISKTWGDIKTNINLTENAFHSVGMVISGNESIEEDRIEPDRTTRIEGNVSVEGSRNIGIEADNSSLATKGDIKVGSGTDFKNTYPIGIYAINNTEETGRQLNYTGEGNLTVGNFGSGIITKNYNIDYKGNMTVGVGGVGIFNENDKYSKDKYINVTGGLTLGDNSLPNREKGVGIYGLNTDITFDAKNGMEILSNDRNVGILSVEKGDITYTGDVKISGMEKSENFNKGVDASKGIYKYGTGTITVKDGDWKIGQNSIGIVANSEVKDENGKITVEDGITINNSANMTVGKNSIGIHSLGNNTLTNKGNITVSGAEDKDSSVGIYMGNSKEGEANKSFGTNEGTITVDGKNAVGVQAVGNVEFHNKGKIEVKNSGIGVFATNGASIYNDKEGIIDLTGDSKDTHSIGMFAKGKGSSIINDGTINANFGVGMYVEDEASLTNNGDINLKNGVGIKGNGYLYNNGNINIAEGYFGTDIDNEGKENTSVGSIIDIKDDIVNIGSHYIGMGGTIDSKLDVNLDNPLIDITTGKGLGIVAPNIKGGIGLAPNFALTGNGFSYEVKDFIGENTDINVETSPLFDSKFEGKDLIVNKVDYKDVMKDYKYENFYNSLDNTLKGGIASDIDAIKNMNSYLESFGQTGNFYEEYARTMSEVRGSVYSNIQSRMFDINRSFDNSFDEMEQSYSLSKDTDKYSVIYTGGDYKSGRVEIPDYKYQIMGLQYMREFEETKYDNKYGYTFGFSGSKFKFKDNGRSKENIYSLRAGVHNVKSFNPDLDLLTKLDVGLNYHDMERKLAFGTANYKNDSDFYSYYVGFDNKFRKTLFKDYQNEFGAYIGSELEYGRFTDIKEDGTLALKVKSNDYYIAKGMVGFAGTGRKYLGNDWTAKLTGDIGYSYDFAKYDENKTKLRNSDSGYTSILDEIDTKGKVTGKIGVGFERLNHLGVTLEGEASRDIARDEDYWRVGLRFNYKFNSEEAVTTLRNVFHLMDNHFDFDKHNLKPEEEEIVKVGSKIIDTFNLKGTLRLEGHTDSCGTVKYNQGLSERRAERVKKEFMKNIKKSENIKYETQGYSELRPVDTNKTKKGRANNRRTEVKYIAK